MIDGIGGRMPPVMASLPATTAPVAAPAQVKPASPDLSALAAATRQMGAAPPVDTAKVDRIKNAIAMGTYTVNPEAVAERMIATDLRRG